MFSVAESLRKVPFLSSSLPDMQYIALPFLESLFAIALQTPGIRRSML